MAVVIKKITNIPAMIDELTYRSYKYNRLYKPDITPEEWATVFANVNAMEQRFQQEVKP